MPMTLTHELLVCECCLMALAYDERCECPASEHPEGVAAFKEISVHVHLVPGCEEPEFMANVPCAGCGARLDGDRHKVSGLSCPVGV